MEFTDTGLWTVAQVADYLSLPPSAVYKMTAPKGALHIPHIKLAGRLRFRKADVDRWLETLTVSNVDLLKKVLRKAREVSDGVNSQETIT